MHLAEIRHQQISPYINTEQKFILHFVLSFNSQKQSMLGTRICFNSFHECV